MNRNVGESVARIDLPSEPDQGATVALLDALNDPACRAILHATADRPMTAIELTGSLSLSQSTTYRKLDQLRAAGLLEVSRRIDAAGNHPYQYLCGVDSIHIALADAD